MLWTDWTDIVGGTSGVSGTVSGVSSQITSAEITGVHGCSYVLIRVWDEQTGGTAKQIAQWNTVGRIDEVAGSNENTATNWLYQTNGANIQNVATIRAGFVVAIAPSYGNNPQNNVPTATWAVMVPDRFWFRIVTDATTNPMILRAKARRVYQPFGFTKV